MAIQFKDDELKPSCSICGRRPLSGYGFCKNCYTRLRGRITKYLQTLDLDEREKQDFMRLQMAEYVATVKRGEVCEVLPHRGGRKCISCYGLDRKGNPAKATQVVGRGLCKKCYNKYCRWIEQNKTTWEQLEREGNALPKNHG